MQTAIVHIMLSNCNGLRGTNISGKMGISPLSNRTPIMNPIIIVTMSAMRSILRGLHKRKSIMKPTNVTAITDIVDISTIGISRFLYNANTAARAVKLVSPAGIAL